MGVSDSDRLSDLRRALLGGLVIPAHPLALTEARRLDERRQVALTRYYCDAGAGGIAVGVHTTQFAIRDPGVQLLQPVLDLARRTVRDWCADSEPITIAGVCGLTTQAVREAELAASLGYDAALVSLAALRNQDNERVLDHCRRVAEVIPVMGFYLQPAVGGRILDRAFWRQFLEIERVVAIKVAPFDRYRTVDVAAALAESGRRDVALYTGNDDAIVADLLTPFPGLNGCPLHFSGGLLGQWAVWAMRAVELLRRCLAMTSHPSQSFGEASPMSHGAGGKSSALAGTPEAEIFQLLALGAELTDANAALFDPMHQFAGCIPGIHEVLRRQGLLAGRWCLDPHEDLSPGQMEAIDRVLIRYPHLTDDAFVRENLDEWLN
ncbi:MAG: dihydrodipicolinate synthase family protein [Acidobacteria bacterium]|nr:MAG: dihydrodipicolinate synthase family protein [Acidobacteriota bacterium]